MTLNFNVIKTRSFTWNKNINNNLKSPSLGGGGEADYV